MSDSSQAEKDNRVYENLTKRRISLAVQMIKNEETRAAKVDTICEEDEEGTTESESCSDGEEEFTSDSEEEGLEPEDKKKPKEVNGNLTSTQEEDSSDEESVNSPGKELVKNDNHRWNKSKSLVATPEKGSEVNSSFTSALSNDNFASPVRQQMKNEIKVN